MSVESTMYLSSFVVLLGSPVCLELGRRIGKRHREQELEGSNSGHGSLSAAIFGLMGLLLAFSFSNSAARYQERRVLAVEEANAIGTAYLRVDLLPSEGQPAIRQKFRDYMDSRLATYRALPDIDAAKAELAKSVRIQGEIWSMAVKGSQQSSNPAVMSLTLAALNDMIDIVTTRITGMQRHPPLMIYWILGLLIMASALLAGYETAWSNKRSLLHIIGFAVVLAGALFMIFNLDYPRLGFVHLDAADQVLVDVRASME